jgi:hypothetical protein
MAHDWDPTVFTAFGKEDPETVTYAGTQLGRAVYERGFLGHDGKWFFVQANDPLYLEPEVHAVHLDRPEYRAQRMLYPLIAGGLGLFSPAMVVWSMLVVNLLAWFAGTVATAIFARDTGWSPWWGLAFALNLGLVFEMTIGGAGILAFAAAMWGLVAVQRGSTAWGAIGLTAAVLTREAMLLAVGGIGVLWWRRHRATPWRLIALPLLSAVAWHLYLRVRLGSLQPDAAQVEEIGLPFKGFVHALVMWRDQPMDLAAGLVIAAMLVLLAARTVRSDQAIAWATVGFVPLAVFLTRQVWAESFDMSRAVAPALTGWVLVTFGGRGGTAGASSSRRSLPRTIR